MSLHQPAGHRQGRFGAPGAVLLAFAMLSTLLPLAPARAANRRTPVVEIVERVKPAVVNIHSERSVQALTVPDAFTLTPSQNRINGMGTGMVIDPRGWIVTNHHVVEDVQLLRVRTSDGATYPAKVVAKTPVEDLALLKIEPTRPLPVVPLGTAADLMVGESVIAIGNAYGYEHTVTQGIVSAIKRDVTLNKEVSYKQLIQTNASINPGNSGGPLLNINGEVIGMNVAIRAGAQGIAFAIPVDTVIRVAADMLSSRKRAGVWHGVVGENEADTSTGKLIRELVVERTEAGSPAEKAGLQKSDGVVRVGETQVVTTLDLERAMLDLPAGKAVPVIFRRNGTEKRVDLVLAEVERAPAAVTGDVVWRKLGVRVAVVNAEVVTRVNSQLHGGLAVTEVNPESVASRSGIQRGDILVGLHQWETLTSDNLVFVLTHPDLASFQPLRFYIIRSGTVHRGWLQQIN